MWPSIASGGIVALISAFIGGAAWVVQTLHRLDVRMTAFGQRQEDQTAQFANNGGSTLRDAVDRIERKVDRAGQTLNEHLVDAARQQGIIDTHIAGGDHE